MGSSRSCLARQVAQGANRDVNGSPRLHDVWPRTALPCLTLDGGAVCVAGRGVRAAVR